LEVAVAVAVDLPQIILVLEVEQVVLEPILFLLLAHLSHLFQ
jgi:hypothetical protein